MRGSRIYKDESVLSIVFLNDRGKMINHSLGFLTGCNIYACYTHA